MQRAYLSCLYRGLFSIPPLFFFEVHRVRAISSELKSEDHKVTGSKPVSVRILFPSTSRFLGSSARNLRRLSCDANVKLLGGMPPRSSQWNFLVRELLLGSRLFCENKTFLNFLFSSDNACSV